MAKITKYKNPALQAIRNAIGRCHNPEHQSYRDYGARGIEVCKEWREDLQSFIDYIGPKPSPTLTLDRIDNNKGYEPGNVRWADRKSQQNNRRKKQRKKSFDMHDEVTFNGKTQSWAAWACDLDIGLPGLRLRVHRGDPIEVILAPRKRGKSYATYNGVKKPLKEWCEELNLDYTTTSNFLVRGFTIQQIIDGVPLIRKRSYEGFGKRMTINEWSKETGFRSNRIWGGLNKGQTLEETIKLCREREAVALRCAEERKARQARKVDREHEKKKKRIVQLARDAQKLPASAIQHCIDLLSASIDAMSKRRH